MRDISEFLMDLGLTATLRPFPVRVTYQDSCHLVHGQKIREAPRQLLRSIPGLDFVEMSLADQCCGSAGVYNVTETETALELLERKMDSVQQTKAQIIATANPGCILQLRAGAAIRRTNQEVLHVVELLDRALAYRHMECGGPPPL
jgi:glycolate oxidase iron-sulfur subunit